MAGVRCKVCESPARYDIDQALASNSGSDRAIALRFNVSQHSVTRHKTNHLPLALIETAKLVRRESDFHAYEAVTRIYTRLNLALDACDKELYQEETGTYRFEPTALEHLAKTSAELRKCIETVPKLFAFLELQREQARAKAGEQQELAAIFAGCPWGKILGACLESLGLTNGVAEQAAERMAPGIEAALQAWLLEREG